MNQMEKKTLVLVTNQLQCERIIRAGNAIASMLGSSLLVFSVTDPKYGSNPDALQFLYDTSKQNGAEMTVIFSDAPAKAIHRYIKEQKVTEVLTGIPSNNNSLVYSLWERFQHITFFVVEKDGSVREARKAEMLADRNNGQQKA